MGGVAPTHSSSQRLSKIYPKHMVSITERQEVHCIVSEQILSAEQKVYN